jgi:hypothetical protein
MGTLWELVPQSPQMAKWAVFQDFRCVAASLYAEKAVYTSRYVNEPHRDPLCAQRRLTDAPLAAGVVAARLAGAVRIIRLRCTD